MAVGAGLTFLGGLLLAGTYTAIMRPDAAKVAGIEMTPSLLTMAVVFSSIFIAGGFYVLQTNLLLIASVLQ
jgi:hypothetical protein